MTEKMIPEGCMADAKGRLVPEHLVKPTDKLQDQLVRVMMKHAEELSARIARFKGHCHDDVGGFLSILSEQYGAKRGGAKGNMTFTTYDGLMKVQVAVADTTTFGPQLQIAKTLIDECITEWSEGVNANIRALVEHAFRVDKEGQVSRDALYALRRLDIEDERWKRAMQAITDAEIIEGSKTYLRFYRRARAEDGFVQVTIDLASS